MDSYVQMTGVKVDDESNSDHRQYTWLGSRLGQGILGLGLRRGGQRPNG
jgi:hypothetical protein